jgi:hypothetical protein
MNDAPNDYILEAKQACGWAGVECVSVVDGYDRDSTTFHRLSVTWRHDGKEITYHWVYTPGIEAPESMGIWIRETIHEFAGDPAD